MRFARGEEEREFAAVVQAIHAADLQLQQEVGEPGSGASASFRVLQFLPDSRHAEGHTRDRSGRDRSRLDAGRTSG